MFKSYCRKILNCNTKSGTGIAIKFGISYMRRFCTLNDTFLISKYINYNLNPYFNFCVKKVASLLLLDSARLHRLK